MKNKNEKEGKKMMTNNLNQYIRVEYEKLKTETEQREFVEKFRFLMMANDNAFSNYYSNRNLTKGEFYSVADTLYDLNNLWMLSGFIRQNRQVLFQEIQTSMDGLKRPDFTETCKFGKILCCQECSRSWRISVLMTVWWQRVRDWTIA